MANEKEDAAGIIDAQFSAQESYRAANFLDINGQGYLNSSNFASACDESPKRAIPPVLVGHRTPVASDSSSESICRVDLPSDLIVSSPMKLSDILSLLLESSPEKSAAPTTNEVGRADASLLPETGAYVNGNEPSSQLVAGTVPPLLRRSHSWQSGDGGLLRRQSDSGDSDVAWRKSLPLLRRTKSLGDIHTCRHYQHATSPSMQAWFPSISMAAPAAVDVLNDLYETITADQQLSGPPVVNILGYSLPLVSVDGDSASYVCVTDVFQTFFSTRHWDEFKTILEKNGIQSVSTAMSSNDNTFGVPEIVDVIDVKQVESLLLSNQARKDGFVRCLRLSMDGKKSSFDSSTAESKVIMMPERHVGELSSGIRTRHADQSDILYVELEGQTLPSIILNGVQYVRLVDVQQKFFTPTAADDKPQPSPTTTALAKWLQILKKACETLKIEVLKCKPNEKARMVVYAHSCHSSSLHIIAAEQLPRLIEFVRLGKNRAAKKAATPKTNIAKRSKAQSSFSSSSPRVSAADDWSSDYSCSISTPSGFSPSSRPDSVDSRGSSSTSNSGVFTAPPSPIFERSSTSAGTKRRATLDGRSDGERKRRRKSPLPPYLGKRAMSNMGKWDRSTTSEASVAIWQNGRLKKHSCSADNSSSPIRINLDDSMTDDNDQSLGVSGTGISAPPLEISFVIDPADDLMLGRDEDNLVDILTPKEAVAPCKIVVNHSPALPVVVYNRRGSRGSAGKYFDHLFVSKNAVCIWCYGCGEYFSAYDFLHHGHDHSPAVPDPQLFMWVSNIADAKLELWRSLVRKAKVFNLKNVLRYDLPDDFGQEEKETSGGSAQSRSGKSSVGNGSRRSLREVVIGGGPTAPAPPVFRRRQVRGDAYVDVMERFSAAGYKSPTASVLGLHSDEHESAVDASYAA